MKLGVITVLFGDRPLDEALAYFKSLGIEELEVGAGGYPGKAHCDPAVLLNDEAKPWSKSTWSPAASNPDTLTKGAPVSGVPFFTTCYCHK